MSRFHRIVLNFIAVALAGLVAAACSAETATSDFEDIDHSNFDNPTNIDNEWFPLKPGTQYVYEGTTDEDGEIIPHTVVFTVTDLTKTVDGIRTVVVWDQDFSDNELVETELAFFAQDNDGVVWHLGQYPEEYEDGELVEAPAWIAGLGDSKAGIQMMAEPEAVSRSFSQGWAPSVDWNDRSQVNAAGQETCVEYDCFENVLVMDEFNPGEPDAFQLKYYAPGVGLVQVGWRGENEESHEELALVDYRQLNADELAAVRESALELEQSAYEISEDVYGQTIPIELP